MYFLITHLFYDIFSDEIKCGGNYTSEVGVIVSPNYPYLYNQNISCVWIVTVNDSSLISLKFTMMDIEYVKDCRFDYVEVRIHCY